jgi:hypothetical protein
VKGNNKFIGLFIGSVALAAIIILGGYWKHFFGDLGYELSNKPGDWGAFGDYFGGILNPIVGIATLVLIAITLQLTRKALIQNEKALKQAQIALEQGEKVIRQNADELKASRDELKESRIAQQRLADIEAENLKQNSLERKLKHLTLIESSLINEWQENLKLHIQLKRDHPDRFSISKLIESYENSDTYIGLRSDNIVRVAPTINIMLDYAMKLCRIFTELDAVALALDIPLISSTRGEVFKFKENLLKLRSDPNTAGFLFEHPLIREGVNNLINTHADYPYRVSNII